MSIDTFNAAAEAERLKNIAEHGSPEEKAAALDEIVRRQQDTGTAREAAAARDAEYNRLMQEGTRESRRKAFALKFEDIN